MMMEADNLRLEERAGLLARNYWTKVYTNDCSDLIQLMNKLTELDCRRRFTQPRGNINVLIESRRD